MSELAIIERNHGDLIQSVVMRLAKEAPKLADLGPEELRRIAIITQVDGLTDELKEKVARAKVDYARFRADFLADKAKNSKDTLRNYSYALKHVEDWCAARSITLLEMRAADADAYIRGLRTSSGAPMAPGTVRTRIAPINSFFTDLIRWNENVPLRNPFRGTRALPKMKAARQLAVPTEAEVKLMVKKAGPGWLRAAVVTMADAGLRVGGLPGLSISGERWTTTSKGKENRGPLPETVRDAIGKAKLPLRAPFAELGAGQIADAFRYLVGKLYDADKLKARYSVHDLRHHFAVKTYKATHDMYGVCKLLNHANIGVTERYLRSIGLAD